MSSHLPTPEDILSPSVKTTLDATPAGLVVIDHRQQVALANRAAANLLQWTASEVQGKPADFLLSAWVQESADPKRVSDILHLPLAEAGTTARDQLVEREDGTFFPAQIDLNPLQTTEGRWIVATIIDLSEQKRLESSAKGGQEQLKAYWEAASEGLITVDTAGSIRVFSDAAERIFGYERADVLGQPLDMLLPEEARQQHATLRRGFFEQPGKRPMAGGADIRARRKDGTIFEARVTLTYVKLSEETIAIALISDQTERKRLEQAVAEASERVLSLMGSGTGGRKPAPAGQPASRDDFEASLAQKCAGPQGWYLVVFTVRHLRLLSDRLGKATVARLVDFAIAYITQSLHDGEAELFRWGGGTMVALLQRASFAETRQEVSEITGRRLEHLIERGSGGSALVLVSLASKILPIEGQQPSELIVRIEEAAQAR